MVANQVRPPKEPHLPADRRQGGSHIFPDNKPSGDMGHRIRQALRIFVRACCRPGCPNRQSPLLEPRLSKSSGKHAQIRFSHVALVVTCGDNAMGFCGILAPALR